MAQKSEPLKPRTCCYETIYKLRCLLTYGLLLGNNNNNNGHPFFCKPISVSFQKSIYPSICYSCFFPTWGRRGLLSLSQLLRGKRQGTPWMGGQPIAGLTLKDKETFTLTLTYSQFRLINSPDKHVFGSWEETGVLAENPHMHRNNMQTPHRKAGDEIQTPNLLSVRRQC